MNWQTAPTQAHNNASVQDIFMRYDGVPASPTLHSMNAQLVRERLLITRGLPLAETDLDVINRAFGSFYADGPGIDFWGSRAGDVNVIEVADVDRGVRLGARSFQRAVKKTRIGLFDAFVVRVEERVEAAAQPEAIEGVAQRAVGIRDHRELETARAKRGKRRPDLVRHRFPQIELLVIRVELGQRRRRRLR